MGRLSHAGYHPTMDCRGISAPASKAPLYHLALLFTSLVLPIFPSLLTLPRRVLPLSKDVVTEALACGCWAQLWHCGGAIGSSWRQLHPPALPHRGDQQALSRCLHLIPRWLHPIQTSKRIMTLKIYWTRAGLEINHNALADNTWSNTELNSHLLPVGYYCQPQVHRRSIYTDVSNEDVFPKTHRLKIS